MRRNECDMLSDGTNLTGLDRRLLAALAENSRASITELAGKTRASRNTVKMRLDRLIETRVIRRFTIETDASALTGVRAIAMIELQGSMSRAVIQALRALPQVQTLHSTNGNWDLVAEIFAPDLPAIDAVLRRIREIPGVLNSETNLLLSPV